MNELILSQDAVEELLRHELVGCTPFPAGTVEQVAAAIVALARRPASPDAAPVSR